VDKDGSSTYSKVVSVNFGDKQTFSIIPNPARDFANIRFSQMVEKATILVYDINGKAVLNQSLISANGFKLNTQSLINGVYEIKINTSNGSFNEKLLINK
jgi:dTDP-4-dehydrorhamnose 3,5-epimerase-like enzyme